MTDPNMPNNKTQAEIYLNARKLALLDLAKEIADNNITTSSQITGLIFNKIEELDEQLES